jgi:uncharacterized membrane-anchored protein YjiN (DUF445 family)
MSEGRRQKCGFQLTKAAGGQAEKPKPSDTTKIRVTSEGPPSRAFVVRRGRRFMTANHNPQLLHKSNDLQGAAELRRIKLVAVTVLCGCLILLFTARALEWRHPAFGFVAAFAEAATIGGLADWYAVVALFRRPLGLPIPHTAIIPSNQQRIADKLGEFIEEQFLDAAPVEAKLNQTDFAAFLSDWLDDRKRSSNFARFLVRLMPEAIAAAESSGLKTFVARRAQAELQSIDFTPVAAGALRTFVMTGGHQRLLDDMMAAAHQALNRPETLAAIREKIRAELPTLLKFYRADAYLLKKVAASAASFFEDVRTNPEHPLRGEIDRQAVSLIERLATDPALAAKLRAVERDLLSRPEVGELAERLWSNVKTFIERSATGEITVLQNRLAQLLREVGAQLANDSEMRAEINRGCVAAASRLIAEHKNAVSTFIADQVKAWNMDQLIGVIELNVGKDLQYIRFNGTLIGGLAGLLLHTGEMLLRVT